MTRTKGSKNISQGNAGGDRRSDDFKKLKAEREQAERERKEANAAAFFARRQGGCTSIPRQVAHPLSPDNLKQSQELMGTVLDHFSMPRGKHVPNRGIVDIANDSWEVDYDVESAEAQKVAEGVAEQHEKRSYQPADGTPLFNYLKQVCKRIKRSDSMKSQKYVHPQKASPLAAGLGSSPDPNNFYIPDTVRIWIPDHQYNGVSFQFKCIHCQSADVSTKYQTAWRPAIAYGDVHWVFFYRAKCNSDCCNRTFSTIDPAFVSTLPSCIVDDFEYIFPPKGPGVLTDMMRSFSLQLSNHILFGAWTKQVNDIIWQKYFRKSNQYYELLHYWLNEWPSLGDYRGSCPLHAHGYNGKPIMPYSAFGESGHHNGILMTEGLAKTLFQIFEGGKRFEYNQKSFANWHDNGLRADDTFKICKKVHMTTSGKQRVQPFSSVLTLLSKAGKVVAACWKMSMSHEVNTQLLEGIKVAREYKGAPPLKLLQTDNPVGEEKPYKDMFPSLCQGITAGTPGNLILPALELPDKDIQVFVSHAPAEGFFLTLLDFFPDDIEVYYGLDTEFETASPQELTVLSLAFPRHLNECQVGTNATDEANLSLPPAIVLHLHKMKKFPGSLKGLLEKKNMIPVGRQIGGDCSKLEEQYEVRIERRIELGNLCTAESPQLVEVRGGLKLNSLMEYYLECRYPMDKSAAQVQSYARSLTATDVQYCALDAMVSLLVGCKAFELLETKSRENTNHTVLEVGKRCSVTYRGREIARGKLVVVGQRGEQRRWNGKDKLGKRDCLVLVQEVININFKPNKRSDLWPDTQQTLQQLSDWSSDNACDLELLVAMRQIRIIREDSNEDEAQSQHGPAAHIARFEPGWVYFRGLMEAAKMQIGTTADVEIGTEDTSQQPGPTISNEVLSDNEPIWSRSIRDMFHQFHDLPLPKKGPKSVAKPYLYQLVIHASYIHDTEDFDNVVNVLQNKHGVDNMVGHFYYNRDYWRQRVQKFTPTPETHGDQIANVRRIVWTERGFEEYRSPELKAWLDKFEENARRGLYSMPSDMKWYRLKHVDSDGLNVYYTDMSTGLNECAHQKMADLVGHCVVGVEVADTLLVLRLFRFNIAIGIGRCGEPDFQTDRHDIVDKTQHWILHTFGVYPWPSHANLLDFDPPRNSTLVGLGPLKFDPNHVVSAESPAPHLSRDHAYLSRKLQVKVAPLPVSGKDEFVLFNKTIHGICKEGRNPTRNDWDHIARAFLQHNLKGNKNIYPKTIDQLKKYYNRWQHNQKVRLLGKQLNLGSLPLVQGLQCRTGPVSSIQRVKLPPDAKAMAKPIHIMPNVVPPDSAPSQRNHVGLKLKKAKKQKKDQRTYEDLLLLPRGKLQKHAQRCAWYPFCREQVWTCRGYSFVQCTIISKLDEKVKQGIKESLMQNQTKKKLKNENDSRTRKLKQLKKRKRENTAEVIEIDDDATEPAVMQCVYYAKRHAAGIIVLPSRLNELATVGMSVGDINVDAYLALFVNKCLTSLGRDDISAVQAAMFPCMRGHRDVGRPSFDADIKRKYWHDEKKVHLVPGFFAGCHWAAVIVDMRCSKNSATIAFIDSVGSMRSDDYADGSRVLQDAPFFDAENYVLMDSPDQARCSNDCAAYMLGAFAHWILCRTEETHCPRRFQLNEGTTPSSYGLQMRKHIHTSIKAGDVNLDDPILHSMTLI